MKLLHKIPTTTYNVRYMDLNKMKVYDKKTKKILFKMYIQYIKSHDEIIENTLNTYNVFI